MDDFPIRVMKLKSFLTNKESNPDNYSFFNKAYSKITTKTYLTDRGQTGGHQTNREKRWEAHPKSVHFALYQNCLQVEYKLVVQILEFYDFPINLIEILEKQDYFKR